MPNQPKGDRTVAKKRALNIFPFASFAPLCEPDSSRKGAKLGKEKAAPVKTWARNKIPFASFAPLREPD